jgi:hypothetical protein
VYKCLKKRRTVARSSATRVFVLSGKRVTNWAALSTLRLFDNQVSLCPLRKLSSDGPLPAHRFIGIASRAKLFEERFDLVVKQTK